MAAAVASDATCEKTNVVEVEAVVPACDGSKQEEIANANTFDDAKPGVAPTTAPWPLWKLCLLALPQLGVQVMWCFLGPCSAPFMVHLGMGHSLATLNNIAGPVVGFFTGPLVGAWSDRCTSRFGRRRPIIIGGLISTWVAGILFAASEHMISGSGAIAFAAPMFWVLDVTVNVLQTPNRALVADLASEEQQVPMQVVFVFFMAIGNFIGFSIMQIYAVPTDHMLELMLIICSINTVCVLIQSLVAKETPLVRSAESSSSCCGPVVSIFRSVKGMPRLFYHLAAVQCLVWIGNTAWNNYGAQWFANSVYGGDQHAPEGSPEKIAYGKGMAAFGLGGQIKAGLQLTSALIIIALLLKTTVRPRTVYAPCVLIGAVVNFLASFAVGTSGAFATVCFLISILPETGSFAIPFGLVATLNKRAEQEGKQVSTALQMALLNCCVTVGQQICTLSLAAIEAGIPDLKEALPYVFILAGVAHSLGGVGAAFLNDRPPQAIETSDPSETVKV
eukprot:gb/GFBE01076676.1/.p1 GENE.gb/GFBE01076676.1/~~gb/GFBE01076676.1/.p1  ORF type:complete len:504 (+),score=102.59 gb/GFBE01076676.1/:1-1512(+)